jgi:hypothetical protein
MKQTKTTTLVLVLALTMAFGGCVDSKSGDSAGGPAEETDGAADAAHYLDLIDVHSMHYKATASGDGKDAVVLEEWRKKSGNIWLFKLVVTNSQDPDSGITILQNPGGLYMIGDDGVAIKTAECSNENIGFMNPFQAYGYYGDESVWDGAWVVDRNAEHKGREAIKLDYSGLWKLQNVFGDEDLHPEKSDLIVDKKTGFTLLLDWKWSHNGKTESIRYEVTEFDVNGNIPDSTFEIPESAEIVDLTAIGELGGGSGDGGDEEQSHGAPPGPPPLPE